MTKTDYNQFTLKQLKDALEEINEEQSPEDAKIISALIQAENIYPSHKSTDFSQKNKNEKQED